MRGAKKRFEAMFSSSKNSEKSEFKKWAINKEYTLSFHDSQTSEEEILLNSEVFKGIDDNETIEITFVSKPNIKLIFQIAKSKNLEKTKTNISLISSYVDLIKTNYDFNIAKSKVFMHVPVKNEFELEQANLIFKEKFITRKDIFQITQNLIDQVVYQNQQLKLINYDKEDMTVGYIDKLRLSKTTMSLTGIFTSSTNIKLYSIASDLFFLFEISSNSYHFTPNLKMRYELVIEYFKIILTKMQEEECYHRIHILFYTRIFFKKQNHGEAMQYVYQSNIFSNEYFLDVYSMIEKECISKMDITETCKAIYQAFSSFSEIQSYKNMDEFLESIKSSFIFHYDNLINFTTEKINKNLMASAYEYQKNFFNDVSDFRLAQANTANLFEAICVAINEITAEQNPFTRIGTMINVIISGDHFPYYNNQLANKVCQFINEEFIPLTITVAASRIKMEMYQNASGKDSPSVRYDYTCNNNNNDNNNNGEGEDNSKDYLLLDNFTHKPPEWCRIFCVPDSAIDYSLINYAEKHKAYYNQKNEMNRENLVEISSNSLINEIDTNIFNLKEDEDPLFQFKNRAQMCIVENNIEINKPKNILSKANSFIMNEDKDKDKLIIKCKSSKKCCRKTLNEIKEMYNIFKDESYGNSNNCCLTPQPKNIIDTLDIMNIFSHYITNKIDRKDGSFLAHQINYDNNIYHKEKIKRNNSTRFLDEGLLISSNEKYNTSKDLHQLEKELLYVSLPSFFDLHQNYELDNKVINLYTSNFPSHKIEEMILARINANFLIMTNNDTITEQRINFNKLSNISLCNRKYSHDLTISGESCEFKFRLVNRSHKVFNYYFLVYDDTTKIFFMKQTHRKEPKDWSAADNLMGSNHVPNDLHCIDNLNEQTTLKYLLIEKKKKAKKGIIRKAPTIFPENELQLGLSTFNNVEAHLSMNLPISNGMIDMLKIHSSDPKKSQEQLMNSSTNEISAMILDAISFNDRITKFLIDLEQNIMNKQQGSNYTNGSNGKNNRNTNTSKRNDSTSMITINQKEEDSSNKLNKKVQYISVTEYDTIQHKREAVSLYHLQKYHDWVSLFVSSEYNEKTGIFLSLQWISCKSLFIDTFVKEINKLAKRNNLRIVPIQSKYYLNFNFNKTAVWKFDAYEKITIAKTMQLIVFNDAIRCEYEMNREIAIVFYQETCNVMVKIIDNSIILYCDIENSKESQAHYALYFIRVNEVVEMFKHFKKRLNDAITNIENIQQQQNLHHQHNKSFN